MTLRRRKRVFTETEFRNQMVAAAAEYEVPPHLYLFQSH
jgi:hypothetical protein